MKYVYFFSKGKSEGSASMKDLLGGKGANLAEMASLGIPVPPGFTITTRTCIHYLEQQRITDELRTQVAAALARTPVAVASYRGRPGHPTAFRRDVFARLLGPEANHGADKLVQELRRQGQVLEVDCDDPGVVRNINTRDRLQRFLAGKID